MFCILCWLWLSKHNIRSSQFWSKYLCACHCFRNADNMTLSCIITWNHQLPPRRYMYRVTLTGGIISFLRAISVIQASMSGFSNHRFPNNEVTVDLQYIPRNMHTVFALLCFVVVIHWLIFPYPSGLLHWHCGNLTIAPVPAKQPWWIWINT